MKSNTEEKGKKRSKKEQLLRGWKKIPPAVRIFILVSACAGVVLLCAAGFRQPKTAVGGGTPASDRTGSGASGTETELSESKDTGGTPSAGSSGGKKESSGKKASGTSSKTGGKDSKKNRKKTESSGKSSGKTGSEKSGAAASKKEEK